MTKQRFEHKLKIKKGDNVKVIAGNDKGKTGKVISVVAKKQRVFVDGVNIVKKHQKPDAKNPDGGIVKQEAAIHISNVMLIDPKSGEATRIGSRRADGKVERVSKKSGEVI